jgi:hypothetical protein
MTRKRSGETAMKHARAWAATSYPGALCLEAGARLAWIPDGKRPGERRPISLSEDLFGTFDLAVFPVARHDDRVQLVQVTTMPASGHVTGTVTGRRHRVAHWIEHELGSGQPMWLGQVAVIAWIPRRHFRRWVWRWGTSAWEETEPLLAPLPRKARETRATRPRSVSESACRKTGTRAGGCNAALRDLGWDEAVRSRADTRQGD